MGAAPHPFFKGKALGTRLPIGSRGGEYFEVILSGTFKGWGRGKSKITSRFFVKYIISRTVDKVTADSVAVERSF